jgi:hypothetical protein
VTCGRSTSRPCMAENWRSSLPNLEPRRSEHTTFFPSTVRPSRMRSESQADSSKMRRLEDPRRSPSVSLHTPHSNASSSEMQQQQQQQQQHFHQQTQVPMTVPWQQPQPSQQPRLDRRMSFTAANPPMYTTASASAPPNILNTMLPPASTAFDLRGQSPKNYLQNPSPTGFLDPSSLSTGSSTLQMDQGGPCKV